MTCLHTASVELSKCPEDSAVTCCVHASSTRAHMNMSPVQEAAMDILVKDKVLMSQAGRLHLPGTCMTHHIAPRKQLFLFCFKFEHMAIKDYTAAPTLGGSFSSVKP